MKIGIETDRGPWVQGAAGRRLPSVRDQPGCAKDAGLHNLPLDDLPLHELTLHDLPLHNGAANQLLGRLSGTRLSGEVR